MRRGALIVVALACAACDDEDGFKDGARGSCAAGGELAGCPDSARTPAAACWRLVECGSIALDAEQEGDPNRFDWGRCVDELEDMVDARAQVIMACIAASTCDELLAPGAPHSYDVPFCWRYGAQ